MADEQSWFDKLTSNMGKRRVPHSDVENIEHWKDSEWARDAKKNISAPELMYDAIGGAVGGGAGYLLSKLLYRKPSTKLRLLYTLLGAGTGALGTHLGMKTMSGPEGFSGSLPEYLRIKETYQDLNDRIDEENKKSNGRLEGLTDEERTIYDGLDLGEANKVGLGTGAIGALATLYPSYKGKFITNLFNGSAQTQESLNQLTSRMTPGEINQLAANLNNPNYTPPTIGGAVNTDTVKTLIPTYDSTIGTPYDPAAATSGGPNWWKSLRALWGRGRGEVVTKDGGKSVKWKQPGLRGGTINMIAGAGGGYVVGGGLELLTQAMLGRTRNRKNYNPITDWK